MKLKMKKELVISTIYSQLEKAVSLAEDCYLKTNIRSTIVCQLFEVAHQSFDNKCEQAYSIIYSSDRGLARSRMLGVLSSDADLIWLTDDDIEVTPEGVIKAFDRLENSEDDFITTKYAMDETQVRKKYSLSEFVHNRMSIMKVSSIEIFIKRDNVINKGVAFDTRFGLGATHKSGEENIFLADILNKGGKGCFVPIITSIHREITSGGDFSNDLANSAKGAIFRRVFGLFGAPLLFAFYVKRLIKKEVRFTDFFSALVFSVKGFFKLK